MMELATKDLLQEINLCKYIDEQRACRWFHHLLQGMSHCHSLGIVHRDLKCENLLLDKHNILKISDFGFARANFSPFLIGNRLNNDRVRIRSSTFCGSFAYSSPEILKAKPYEPHLADTWSMGIILFTMVFGRLPFNDKTIGTLRKQVQKPLTFPTSPRVSHNCKELIKKILKPEAEQRIYFPGIRDDMWYKLMYDSQWDLEVRIARSIFGLNYNKVDHKRTETEEIARIPSQKNVQEE